MKFFKNKKNRFANILVFVFLSFLFFCSDVYASELYNDVSTNTTVGCDAGWDFGVHFNTGSYNTLTSVVLYSNSVTTNITVDICEYSITSHIVSCDNLVYTDSVVSANITPSGYTYYFDTNELDEYTDYWLRITSVSAVNWKIDTTNEHSDVEVFVNDQDYYTIYDFTGVINADTNSTTFSYDDFDSYSVSDDVCSVSSQWTCSGNATSNVNSDFYTTFPNQLSLNTQGLNTANSIVFDTETVFTEQEFFVDVSFDFTGSNSFIIYFLDSSDNILNYLLVDNDQSIYLGVDHKSIVFPDDYFVNLKFTHEVYGASTQLSLWIDGVFKGSGLYGGTEDEISKIAFNTSDSTDLNIDSLYNIDDMSATSSSSLVTDSSLVWHYPQNGYDVSNDSFNDWGVYYQLAEYDVYDYVLLKIFYYDILGNTFLDYDFVSTTTDLTYWTVERGNYLETGIVSAWGELIGTDLDNCNSVDEDSCLWYSIESLDLINFEATSTSISIYDYGTTGFIPATSTLFDYYGASSTAEYSFLQLILNNAFKSISVVFPFNIGTNMLIQWNRSETLELPSAFSFITDIFENGNVYLSLPSNIFGDSATTTAVFGQQAFQDIDDSTEWTVFNDLRLLSTYLLYIVFGLGMYFRGKGLYQEYINPERVKIGNNGYL